MFQGDPRLSLTRPDLQDLVTHQYLQAHVDEALVDDQIIAIPGTCRHRPKETDHGEIETTIEGSVDRRLVDGRHQETFATTGIIHATSTSREPEEGLGMAHLQRAQRIRTRPRSMLLHSEGVGLDEVVAGAIMNIAGEEEACTRTSEMCSGLAAGREDRRDAKKSF